MKTSISPSVSAFRLALLASVFSVATPAFAAEPYGGITDTPAPAAAASTGGFSTTAGVQTGTLGAAPTGADAATAADATKTADAAKDACKSGSASKAPNAAGAAAAAKLDKDRCERPHYETAMGMMTDPNTPVANTKPATDAIDMSKVTMLDAKPTNFNAATGQSTLKVGQQVAISDNAMSNQLSVLNKTAPKMGTINFGGYDSLAGMAATQQVQTTSLGAAQIQAMRDAEGRATVVLGGDDTNGISKLSPHGLNGRSVAWDDSLVKTGTEVANTTSFHQAAPGPNTDDYGNVVVPKGVNATSKQLDMAAYINQKGVDLGEPEAVRKVAVSTVYRESSMDTMNYPHTDNPKKGSSAYGLGQYTTDTWNGVTDKQFGEVMNRNNTDNQIDVLYSDIDKRYQTYSKSSSLQSNYPDFGQYDYINHYAGSLSAPQYRIDEANTVYSQHHVTGDNLFAVVNNGTSGGGSIVSSPAKSTSFASGGGSFSSGGNPIGSVIQSVTGGGGIKTGNSTIDSVVNGVIGGQGTNLNGMLNTGSTQLSSNPLLGALGGGGSSSGGSTGSTSRPVTVNIDNDTSTLTEVTTKDGVKTTTVTKTDNSGKVLETSTTTEKVAEPGTVTTVTVKDGVKTTTVTKTDSTGKVQSTTTTEKVDAVATTK